MDVMEKLVELLSKYFDIGDSYAYNLTRVKSAFACGTMGFDDFEEFDEETVEDIASYLIKNGVTVQEWISVKERLPQEKVDCIVHYKHAYCDNDDYWAIGMCFYDGEKFQFDPAYKVTHWMPMPQPLKGEWLIWLKMFVLL